MSEFGQRHPEHHSPRPQWYGADTNDTLSCHTLLYTYLSWELNSEFALYICLNIMNITFSFLVWQPTKVSRRESMVQVCIMGFETYTCICMTVSVSLYSCFKASIMTINVFQFSELVPKSDHQASRNFSPPFHVLDFVVYLATLAFVIVNRWQNWNTDNTYRDCALTSPNDDICIMETHSVRVCTKLVDFRHFVGKLAPVRKKWTHSL